MAGERDPRYLIEVILDTGKSPEEVCQGDPELQAEVRARLQHVRLLEVQFDVLLPSSFAPAAGTETPSPWIAQPPHLSGYDVQDELGRSGMGVVYRAWDQSLHRPVALKMLLAGEFARPDERKRFRREAEAAAGLRHANIVQVYQVGEIEGRPYFLMEFVEGGSLAQKLSGTPLAADEAAELLATLAGAVQTAHDGGVVHRDLKPSNVMLTADGTPKITDFGLSHRLDDGSVLTLSGATLGTPSYMAPEQARAKSGDIGSAADVYSLGAMLYEMLTGRPPFRAETPSETLRQAVEQVPVSPSRLNARVPRDLETICLKCLHKEPQRRYASAGALAEDLRCFQRGEPIKARPVSSLERLLRWARRRPAEAVVLAGGILITAALVAGALLFWVEQLRTVQAVLEDMRRVREFQADADWPRAEAAIGSAEVRLGGLWAEGIRLQVRQARRELRLVTRLEEIRLRRTITPDRLFNKAEADKDYQDAFHESGLGTPIDAPEAVAARIKESAVRGALIAALDDWAVSARGDRRAWVFRVARLADPDPWRDRVRNPAIWIDKAALTDMARTAPISEQPVPLLVVFGQRLRAAGGNAVEFMTRVQKANPADFWANYILAEALVGDDPEESIRYVQAALAVRPGAAYVSNNLGSALADTGRIDDANEFFRRALRFDPGYAQARRNLVESLKFIGKLDEVIDVTREGIAREPNDPTARRELRWLLVRAGRGEEARVSWWKELEAGPPDHDTWFGYAELCLFLGLGDEYRRARQDLLRRFGASADPAVAERTGRACMLLPGSADELRKACALIDQAVATGRSQHDRNLPYFLFAQGLAEYRLDRLDGAINLLQGEASKVMGPAPRLVVAMALHRLGRKEEARKTLAAAIRNGAEITS